MKLIHLLLALALLPQDDSDYDKGKDLLLEGKTAEGAALLQSYCEKNKEPVDAFSCLAKAYMDLKEPAKAVAALMMAKDAGHDLNKKPLQNLWMKLLDDLLGDGGDPKTAVPALEALMDSDLPAQLKVQIDFALLGAYAKLKDEENIEKIEKRIFSTPRSGNAYRAVALRYLEADVRIEKAIELLTKGIELLKTEPAARGEGSSDPERERDAYIWMYKSYLAFAYWRVGKIDNPIAAGDGEPGATFGDSTEKAGLKGAGGVRIAVGDFDGDGWDDLWLGGTIYRNNRGRFEMWSKEGEFGGSGALWGDLDNDGNLDLAVFAQPKMRLFRNEGGKLVEKIGSSKLPDFPSPPDGNGLVDVNGDGLLDIYCALYESGSLSNGYPDHLFINKGGFVFEDHPRDDKLCGRGVSPADFDNDGAQEIYVCNYRLNPNWLFKSDGKGNLTDLAEERGVKGVEVGGAYGHSIGACWGDLDNDGDLDLVVGNLAHPRFITFSNKTMVYQNLGEKGGWKFKDLFAESGIEYEETHSDVSMCDYDNDGRLDIYFTSVYRERPNFLYRNQGGFKFKRVTWKAGPLSFDGWGHAWLDYDNDGDMDLVVCTGHWGTFLYENRLNPKAGWVQFRLHGRGGAVGARITVKAGDSRQIREVVGGRGTTSQDTAVQHFGLGEWAGEVEVEVHWAGGRVQKVKVPSGRLYDMNEPE